MTDFLLTLADVLLSVCLIAAVVKADIDGRKQEPPQGVDGMTLCRRELMKGI